MMNSPPHGTPVTLYKLLDDDPHQDETFATDPLTIKHLVTQDLSQLLNSQPTQRLAADQADPLVAASVVNYGLGITIGESMSSADYPDVESAIRWAIIRFEPRIDPHHLTVKVLPIMTRSQTVSQLSISISAKLLAYPEAMALNLAGTYDLGTAKAMFSP
ncbi:type VI secretion system baseplate subunit TssE [Rosenbergiella collisarenosi]|uniref:type VI secretion system baseplate subunit TssE n=1 Tax=Rosenbergiella collisarenosi TaxID=1544695 RepID=UPI001BD9C9C5|nr:GPW/gp25 family protein [Rosenbergiella collisarenosi]MBT0722629.1 hypothetical protein [Rosenbergiella collisarenosi]